MLSDGKIVAEVSADKRGSSNWSWLKVRPNFTQNPVNSPVPI